jgi:2-C-methyl-D-erythritol 4-phosphate cytidylyltransferase
MVEWSLDALRACESVRSVIVACPPGHVHGLVGDDLVVVNGGITRSQSVANALAAVGTELVAIHDAARPLVTPGLIDALADDLVGAPDAAGCIAAAPVTDTLKQSGGSIRQLSTHEVHNRRLEIERTLDRSTLWAAQTPQVFRTEALRDALASADDPDAATDEAMLLEATGAKVLIHPVSEPNLKVTTALDLRLAELLLADRSRYSVPE